jgi:nitronate monooxygenase
MGTIQTKLTEMLGIKHPILLAPMGSAAGGKLASAVTNAGGLGMIGSGYANPEAVKREILAAGNTPVGVGMILWALDANPSVLAAVLANKPAAIMLSFGDPAPYAKQIKSAGTPLIFQAQTLESAVAAADAGADIIVAQGRDAGGHAGTTRGTVGLVPAVVDAVGPSIPVVAAGGIGDGRGLAAALTLGASGVLMGTRFAISTESLWSEAMKQRVVASGGDDTQQTRVFDIVRNAPWPSHYPGRTIRNDFSERWHGDESNLIADRANLEKAFTATPDDDVDTRAVWAGESADLIKGSPSAADIIDTVIAEAIAALSQSADCIRSS